MSDIGLVIPELADTPALLAFELDNRAFFEAIINARDAAYYALAAVEADIVAAQQEHASGKAFRYLIKRGDDIVGRINLTQVERAYYNRAQLGYRLAEAENGKGYGKAAIAQLLQKAFHEHGLYRVEAHVGWHNPASRAVLERNGFALFGETPQAFCLQGQWQGQWHLHCCSPLGPGLRG